MKYALVALSVSAVVYSGLCLLLYLKQRTLLYYPTPETRTDAAERVRIESGGETLNVWRTSPGKPRAILYFGGNGENVALRVPVLGEMFPDHTAYFIHYRGYGGSTGSPSEDGLFLDAVNVYDDVRTRHGSIAVIGRSLGSGVAVHLASRRAVEKLVLVTPFDSIERVAQDAMRFLPVKLLLKDKYRSVDLAPAIEVPTLVLVAEDDEVIPRRSTDRLIAAFDASRVTISIVPATSHNTIGEHPIYLSRLSEFINSTGRSR